MQTAVEERPILMCAEMVHAILTNRKWITRRVVKQLLHNPEGRSFIYRSGRVWASVSKDEFERGIDFPDSTIADRQFLLIPEGTFTPVKVGKGKDGKGNPLRCPYGRVGDQLWVRENWYVEDWKYRRSLSPAEGGQNIDWVHYKADNENRDVRWKSSIHMPRWASRLTLMVESVHIEQLHSIGAEDIVAEGFPISKQESRQLSREGDDSQIGRKLKDKFREKWIDLNGAESWDANPWVWVVQFHRLFQTR